MSQEKSYAEGCYFIVVARRAAAKMSSALNRPLSDPTSMPLGATNGRHFGDLMLKSISLGRIPRM